MVFDTLGLRSTNPPPVGTRTLTWGLGEPAANARYNTELLSHRDR
jgi:hypothetical protein